jgi:hypothetical protein
MANTSLSGSIRKSNEGKATVRLFPGWWTHIGAKGGDRPLYRVLVRDEDELALAQQLKPSCVRAEYKVLETNGR